MRGRFITVEGQDGAGKSTNIEVIKRYLDEHGTSYIHTREPGGTPFGEQIRNLLLEDSDNNIGDKAELLLIFAARAQHLQQVIEPALNQGKWVLCDRFTDATYAYQGAGRGLNMQEITKLEQHVQGDLRPDLTLLLDVPTEIGEHRAGQRSAPDRFEQQERTFKQRVRDGYLVRAKAEPGRIKVIDASQSLSLVEHSIIAALKSFVSQG